MRGWVDDGYDEVVGLLAVDCTVFGALDGGEAASLLTSSCQCSHTYCGFFSLIQAYLVNTTLVNLTLASPYGYECHLFLVAVDIKYHTR